MLNKKGFLLIESLILVQITILIIFIITSSILIFINSTKIEINYDDEIKNMEMIYE